MLGGARAGSRPWPPPHIKSPDALTSGQGFWLPGHCRDGLRPVVGGEPEYCDGSPTRLGIERYTGYEGHSYVLRRLLRRAACCKSSHTLRMASPLDLTEKIAVEHGRTVDRAGFAEGMAQQRQHSRAAAQARRGARSRQRPLRNVCARLCCVQHR